MITLILTTILTTIVSEAPVPETSFDKRKAVHVTYVHKAAGSLVAELVSLPPNGAHGQ